MYRHPGLVALSREHHHALALCVRTEREMANTSAQLLGTRIVQAYDSELGRHFEVEERILFPVLAGYAGLAGLVAELIGEHRRLTQLVDSLRTRAEIGVVREFSALLEAHARKEERQLFEEAQKLLSEQQLAAFGPLLDAALAPPHCTS